jgi:hypothetical protein
VQKDPHGEGIYWPAIVDPIFTFKIKSFMNHFYAANQEIWRRMTQGNAQSMVFNADSVERLRSLGYVK